MGSAGVGEETDSPSRDFFISYTGSDRKWAEWVAWKLEEAGYATIIQAWDFATGAHFVSEMHTATRIAERTIAILSNSYVTSSFGEAEWQEAWRADPGGAQRKLLVFRIEECPRPGLLGQLVSEDLFGVDEQTATSRLLAAVRPERRKPELPPGFPAQEAPETPIPFPGRLISAPLDDAVKAGGPMTPDNPFAAAFAFWLAVLQDNYENLNAIVTPESIGRWNLDEIRRNAGGGGITTAVNKPCFDIAYVRVLLGVPTDSDALMVAGGFILTEAKIISLVLRPELGGWRVHSFGGALDPANMPRTWRPEQPSSE